MKDKNVLKGNLLALDYLQDKVEISHDSVV